MCIDSVTLNTIIISHDAKRTILHLSLLSNKEENFDGFSSTIKKAAYRKIRTVYISLTLPLIKKISVTITL